jgi:MFS family permease
VGWFLIRGLNGAAGAMSLIPLETYVNRDSPSQHRARNFGFYAFSVALGLALGNLMGLQLLPFAGHLAFVLGGTITCLAGVLALCCLPHSLTQAEARQEAQPLHFRRNFLSFGSAYGQGFLEGGMFAFLALYLISMRLSTDEISWITSGIILGIIVFQVPVTWLGDRLGRANVLLSCYAVVIVSLFCLPFCGPSGWLSLWLFLAGACSASFYPLGLALLGERTPPAVLARANAWFLAINCIGSLSGPALVGVAMDQFGNLAMFAVGQAVVVLLLVVGVTLWLRSRDQEPLAASIGTEMSEKQAA